MKCNILFCIDSFYDGGSEMFVVHLGNSLCEEHSVYILELNKYKSNNKKLMTLLHENITIYQPDKSIIIVFCNFLKQKISSPLIKKTLDKIIEYGKIILVLWFILKKRINVIHSNSWISDFFICRLVKYCNAKFIITLHGHYKLIKSKISDFDKKTIKIISKADHVVYLTKNNIQDLKNIEIEEKKFHQIYNGMPKVNFQNNYSKKDYFSFCIASRAIREKGWEEAIIAVNRINRCNGRNILLHLFGHGDILDNLKNKYKKYPNIIFHGFILNPIEKMQQMDVCLLTSYYYAESMPFSVIEYLSIGKPIIATKIGNIPEMISVKGKLCGFLLDLKNDTISIEQLKKYMEIYIYDPEILKQHSKIARMAFQKFDIENCKKKYLHLYQSSL